MISNEQVIYCHNMDVNPVSVDRVLFWDVPKAASSYIRNVFDSRHKILNRNYSRPGFSQILPDHVSSCKKYVSSFKNNHRFTRRTLKGCFGKFDFKDIGGEVVKHNNILIGVVRNPFDILVSYYYSRFFTSKHRGNVANAGGLSLDWVNHSSLDETSATSSSKANFEDFVKCFFEVKKENNNNCWDARLSENPFFQLFDCDENLACDYILKVEHMSEGVRRISEKFGLPITADVDEKQNISHRRGSYRDYKDMYTEELKDLVYKRYEPILNLFDYTF